MHGATSVERIAYFGRNSVLLSNEKVRAIIDDLGGMMPEFSLKKGKGAINAHWIPDFRGNSGSPWSPQLHGPYWKSNILYILAGDFPCSPNFGPDCTVEDIELPAHGWTANERWKLTSFSTTQDGNAAYAKFTLKSPDSRMPLSYTKYDIVQAGKPAYYSTMIVENHGEVPISINLARHNTLGSPFLQTGCRIYVSADRFMTAPKGTEFDDTSRLAQGVEFDSLCRAPTRDGKMVDLSVVPGMIGYTDFVTGAISPQKSLGWSCVVNPVLKLAYISFFPGSKELPDIDIALGFNDLWMQYGGRNFTPWALHEGGADRTFCLGTENAVAAFSNGLAYSRAYPELLGTPTMVVIPAQGARRLNYGSALVELDDALASEAVIDMEAEGDFLVLKTKSAYQRVTLDASFSEMRALVSHL